MGGVNVAVKHPGDTYAASIKRVVPLQVWSGVKLQRRIDRGLSVFERFIIEALLKLGACDASEISTITGLEERLCAWWLDNAVYLGLANRVGDNKYSAIIDRCEKAASAGTCVGSTTDEVSILWLPVSNDFIILGQRENLVRTLSRVRPVASYPVEPSQIGRARSDLLNTALAAGQVYGAKGSSVVKFDDDDVNVSETTPAYLMEVEMPVRASTDVEATFYSELRGGKKASKNRQRSVSYVRKQCRIPTAERMMCEANELSDTVLSQAYPEIVNLGLNNPRKVDGLVVAEMSREWTLRSARERLIDPHPRLSITLNGEVCVEFSCELVAQDGEVKSMVALDDAVRELLAAEDIVDEFDAVLSDHDLSSSEVRERLWQLREYSAIYQMREREDFLQ